jgi:hypothetical protein
MHRFSLEDLSVMAKEVTGEREVIASYDEVI